DGDDSSCDAPDDHGSSHWIGAAEEDARGRVAEDDRRFSARTVIVAEVPAVPKGNRQRSMVGRRDDLDDHAVVAVDRLTWYAQRIDPHREAQRDPGCRYGGANDAGHLACAFDDVSEGRP